MSYPEEKNKDWLDRLTMVNGPIISIPSCRLSIYDTGVIRDKEMLVPHSTTQPYRPLVSRLIPSHTSYSGIADSRINASQRSCSRREIRYALDKIESTGQW